MQSLFTFKYTVLLGTDKVLHHHSNNMKTGDNLNV